MGLFGIFAAILTLTALLAYVNERLLKLPETVGVMASALAGSLLLLLAGSLGWDLPSPARRVLEGLDFQALLLHGMLGFLLFAGALHVNLGDLLERRWSILSLATMGVLLSTTVVGLGTWALAGLLGRPMPLPHALLFGALVSPTDPIAVLSWLKRGRAPEGLEAIITGESLFNDGIGVVLFLVLLEGVSAGHAFSLGNVAGLFLMEAGGGVLLGLALGYLCYLMVRSVDHYVVEVLLTLALASGGYALARALHVSGPLAMVLAGLLVGNKGRTLGMSERTRRHLDNFWELVDEVLNMVLFVLIGLEVLVLRWSWPHVAAGIAAVALVLAARWTSVILPLSALRVFKTFPTGTLKFLTWGGLRGGISVALALSLPEIPERGLFVVATYVVVVFSVLIQAPTMGKVVGRA
jgi:CPA1 family monovalent cation:H+ antiporter